MVQAYNFKASWQLFPEKGIYEYGDRPVSGIYKIESIEDTRKIKVEQNWVTLENKAYSSAFTVMADNERHPCTDHEDADEMLAFFEDGITFEIQFYRNHQVILKVTHEILPNGYLKIIRQGYRPDGNAYTNTEIFHKQFSVLPYSASVAGAVIRPTEQGVIRHQALTAMEEQTNMQLDQIRRQIELLALQAHEIQKRKELSLLIYNAKLNFAPVIGQTYHLYRKKDESLTISLISPKEWGNPNPYKEFIASVKLLADHTWMEL